MSPPPHELPEHASSGQARKLSRIGLGLMLLGGIAAASSVLIGVTSLTLVGVLYFGLGLLVRGRAAARLRSLGAYVLLQRAVAAIDDGRLEDAEATLGAIPEGANGRMRRGESIVRAQLLLRRGMLDEAAALLDDVFEEKGEVFDAGAQAIQLDLAHATRALVAAAQQDAVRAETEAQLVFGSSMAMPQAKARATLARALLLSHARKTSELAALLEQHRQLLLRATDAAERGVVRALWRQTLLPAQAVYRKQAVQIEDAQSAFLRALSPELSALADAERQSAPAAPAAVRKPIVPRALATGAGGTTRVLALVASLAAACGVFFLITDTPSQAARRSSSPSSLLPLVIPLVLVGVVAWVASQFAKNRRHTQQLVAALAALGEGDLEAAVRHAEPVRQKGTMAGAAQAYLVLASVALEAGEAEKCRKLAVAGRAKLSWESVRAALADSVVANLITVEAYALAALGRQKESDAVMEDLPASAFEPRQRFVVKLVAAARACDEQALRELVDAAPNVLAPFDQLMVDLARASLVGASLVEHRRLHAEIARASERRFLKLVCPALLDRFAAREAPSRLELSGFEQRNVADPELEAAEVEADAAHEGDAAVEPPRRLQR